MLSASGKHLLHPSSTTAEFLLLLRALPHVLVEKYCFMWLAAQHTHKIFNGLKRKVILLTHLSWSSRIWEESKPKGWYCLYEITSQVSSCVSPLSICSGKPVEICEFKGTEGQMGH